MGDILAPTLFSLFSDAVISATLVHHPHSGDRMLYNLGDELVRSRRKMRGSILIQDLEYADDMAISDSIHALKLDEESVAVVEEFKCLGSSILQDCILDREIIMHISKASHTFGSLYKVLWYRKRMKTVTKMCLFMSVDFSTLLYDSETWVSSAANLKRLQAFIMGCLRVILGVTRWDKKHTLH